MRIIPTQALTINEIAKATGAPELPINEPINAIVTNSKEVEKNDLFVALNGDFTSGENFTAEAKRKGAFILSAKDKSADIIVMDTEAALLSIAAYYKTKLRKLKFTIGLTGSVGKTTTKNMIAEILSSSYCVHSTHQNYNNYLGVAHTLLTAPGECEILVIEMGMNHKGEIASLSKAVTPDISVITNVGSAHIGNLGTRQGVAEAKLEIRDGMKNGALIVPLEEELLQGVENSYTFSIESDNADCYLKIKKEYENGALFDIYTKKESVKDIKINVPGIHILSAAAICASVAYIIGSELRLLKDSFSAINESALVRARLIKRASYLIYDDTYSSSYEACLAVLKMLSKRKEKLCCVLGDMLELGESSKELHEKLGAAVVKYGFRKLFTYGKKATSIAIGAIKSGMKKDYIFINENIDAPQITAEQVKDNCEPNDLILFKASHAIHAEKIFDFLN